MRNDERGTIFHEVFQRILDDLFGGTIERRSGLIKNQCGRVSQSARAMAIRCFSPLRAYATLTDNGLVAIRRVYDEIMRIGSTRRLDDLCIRSIEMP